MHLLRGGVCVDTYSITCTYTIHSYRRMTQVRTCARACQRQRVRKNTHHTHVDDYYILSSGVDLSLGEFRARALAFFDVARSSRQIANIDHVI